MNVNINIKIDYTIISIFDRKVFDRIVYKFNWHNITLVKGILTKFDIITTLPYLESIGADYYTIVIEHIISGIIAELHEKLGIEIDKKELCDENMALFENFISELEKNVKDIQMMLKKCTYKVVRKNKSYDKRKLVISDGNRKKIVEAYPFGGWFAWSNTFANAFVTIYATVRLEVLKNLYWLVGRDCDEEEWKNQIEHWDSGKGIDGKTDKVSPFNNIDEKIAALESFENN